MTKRHYWRSTMGKKKIFMSLITSAPDTTLSVMYGMVQCSWFEYYVRKFFANLERKWHKKY